MGEEEEEEGEKQRCSSVPVLSWMRDPVHITRCQQLPLRKVPFLHHRLKSALENMGISDLFPVQVAVWQETLGPGNFERDLCINSPTGSGKTLAYALPIVQKLSTRVVEGIHALVVVPTRDLALQVKQVFDAIALPLGLRVGLAIAQSSRSESLVHMAMPFDSDIVRSQTDVDILVATPGKLMDHIHEAAVTGFTLKHLKYLVVDETDRMLRESYQDWLPNVLKLTVTRCGGVERGFKPYPRLAKMVLSATLTQDPGKLVQLNLHHPLFLSAGKMRYQLPENLESYKLICERKVKPLYLAALLKSMGEEKCIVFTKSVDSTHRLCNLLNCFEKLEIVTKEYSSLQHQRVRSKTLNKFRKGEFQVLVSSDAMTRGMDVEGVRNVINYDVPKYIKTYVHRAGRTARAGQTGRCFTLMSEDEVGRFNKIMKKAEGSACLKHTVPSSSIEALHIDYQSALTKLKEKILESRKKPKKNHSQV